MDTTPDNGQQREQALANLRSKVAHTEDFVLEKSIFSNIFEKDIVRVFIYKKAERLAKAIHLITPAFAESPALRDRIDAIAVGLIDAAVLSSPSSRTVLARELLALSSVLGIARSGGFLSAMNVELIAREAQLFLQEVAAYEEPRLFLEDVPSLAQLMKSTTGARVGAPVQERTKSSARAATPRKGHIKDISTNSRRESIISVIKDKETASIKDISTRIQGVSEKTIQRELQALVGEGLIVKKGERRWSTYSLA